MRARFVPLLCLSLVPGCLCSTPPRVLPDAGTPTDCFEDANCPDPRFFFCNTTTSRCEPSCTQTSDCSDAVRGQFAIAFCDGGLGCQCDLGRCQKAVCVSDAECPAAQACRDGACVAPPAASAVAGCAVTPDYAVLGLGASARFDVLAWDLDRKPVVLQSGIAWSALGPALTQTADGTFTGASPTADAVPAVRATVGGATCTAQVRVLSATPAANELIVLVTDELTGRPIPNATVLVDGASGPTSAQGLATVPAPGALPTVTVSVFHADYGYLTVAHYALTGSRVLSLPLRRNPADRLGGARSTVKNVPLNANFHLGLTGTSVPGLVSDLALTDLSFRSLLGPNVPTRFKIGTAIDSIEQLPTGLYVGFTDQDIKPAVSSAAPAGVCLDAQGNPDEAAIAAGACGTRAAWAFLGDMPLGDLPVDQLARGFGFAGTNFLTFFQRTRDSFHKFESSVVRDVQYTRGAPDAGTSAFTSVDHAYGAVPLALDFAVKLPPRPSVQGGPLDTTLLFGGAFSPGRGFVPLGMGVTPVPRVGDPVPTRVPVRSAPPHHGLEGSPYGLIAFATRNPADANPGLATSAIVARIPSASLKFDPMGATPIDLGATFPAIPDSASYDFLARKLSVVASLPMDPLASLVRVVFTDEAERTWTVWMDPAKAADGFTLPTPPGTFADRTFFNGMTSGGRSAFFVQLVRLDASFAQLAELDSIHADRLAEYTTGFSLVDHARPSIAWTIPSTPNTSVPKGSAVVVTVRGFPIGPDGFVRLAFNPPTAGCPSVDGKQDLSGGKGEIVLTVPNGCVLASAQMTATLMAPAGVPIAPEVTTVLSANIQ